MGGYACGQLSVNILHLHRNGMGSSVIDNAVGSVLGNHLNYLISILTGFVIGNASQNIVDGKLLFIIRIIYNITDTAGKILTILVFYVLPCSSVPLLNLESKGLLLTGFVVKDLGTLNIQIHGGGLGCIPVHNDHGRVDILADGDLAVFIRIFTRLVSGAVGHGEVFTGFGLRNGDHSVFGNIENLEGITVHQRDGKLTFAVGGNRIQTLKTGMLNLEGLICQACHGDCQVEFLVQNILRNSIILRGGDLLGDVQITIALRRVDKVNRRHLIILQGNHGSILVLTVDGLNRVVVIALFGDGVFRICLQSGDVNGLAGIDGKLCLTFREGQRHGYIGTVIVSAGTYQICVTGTTGDDKGKCIACALYSFGHSLGDLDTSGRLDHQLTVVTQNRGSMVL